MERKERKNRGRWYFGREVLKAIYRKFNKTRSGANPELER